LAAYVPVKLIKITPLPSPFFTTNIKNQRTLRDQLHHHYKQTRDTEDWRNFKYAQRYREKVHVRAEVNVHKYKPTSLWKVINSCIPSKDKGTLMYSKNTEVVIANDFNKFIHSIRKMTAR
jgi:hypothetical protein